METRAPVKTFDMLTLLRAVIDSAPDAMFVKNVDGRYVFCNSAASAFFGRASDQIPGLTDDDLFVTKLAARMHDADSIVLRTGIMESFELTVETPAGAGVFQISNSLLRNEAGEIGGVIGIARKLTASLRAERAVREISSFNTNTGTGYFRLLVTHLIQTCRVNIALIGKLDEQRPDRVHTLSVCRQNEMVDNFTYDLKNSPCETVVPNTFCFYPAGVQKEFPMDAMLSEMRAESYMGILLRGSNGKVLGIIAMLHSQSFPFPEESRTILEVVAARAGVELERVLVENKLRASEERNRRILESMPLGIVIHDGSKMLYANSMGLRIIGRDASDELSEVSPIAIVVPEDRERARERMRTIIETGARLPAAELKIQCPDGTIKDIEINSLQIQFADRKCVQVHFSDVTDRRNTREALRETQERFSLFMQHLPGLAWIKNAAGQYIYANQAAMAAFQKSDSKLYGRTDDEIFDRETAEQFKNNDRHVLTTRQALQTCETMIQGDGILHHAIVNKFPIPLRDGTSILIGGVAVDITDRILATDELRRTSDLLRAVAEGTTDAVFVKDEQGRYLLINEPAARLAGKSSADLIGKDDTALFDEESAVRLIENDRRIMSEGRVVTLEETLTANSVTRTFLVTKGPYRNEQGRTVGLFGISRDITERISAERMLRLTQFSIDRAVDSVFWVKADGQILYANEAACRTLGYSREELVGKTVPDIDPNFPPDAWADHWEELKRRGSFTFQSDHVTKDGSVRKTEVTANYLQFDGKEYNCAVMRDITQQKLLEEQLRQSQKMEAVGQLAGGIAHDFNNLLTVINGYCDLLLAQSTNDLSWNDFLTEIKESGRRAAQLTAQLLAFSRRSMSQRRIICLNDVVNASERLLRRLIGEQIDLQVELTPSLRYIKADMNQLEQVLMNLALNARDAMPLGGRLSIQTRQMSPEPSVMPLVEGELPVTWVHLVVSDTGFGIAEQIQSRIFEPFFTTKEIGKGSGLGLAVVHGIVQQNGGQISVTSRPQAGTTFVLQFPAVGQSETVEDDRPLAGIRRGTETVLLVEDDSAVRSVAKRSLESQGYKVLEAPSGIVAQQIAANHNVKIDVLLTDIVMPGISGRALACSLQEIRPGLRVMYVSGYHEDEAIRAISLNNHESFLSKPFTPHELVSRLRELIDAP